MIFSFTLVVSLLIGCFCFIPLFWSMYKKWRVGNLPLIPGDWPLIGHVLMFAQGDAWEKAKAKHLDEKGMLGIMYTHIPVFITGRLDIWEDLLTSRKNLTKGFGYWMFEKILGIGLLTSDGELWRKRRKMITPAFHFDILNDFASIMENKTIDLLKYLEKYEGKSFDVFKVTKPYSMSIMCETAMGHEMSLEESSTDSFKNVYDGAIKLLFRRFLNPLLKSDFIYSFTKNGKLYNELLSNLRNVVRELIEARIRVRDSKDPNLSAVDATKRSKIFIDIMLDSYEKGDIDLDGILDEVNTFVNAGYETTSTALAWCLYCLGRNQRVQDKLYEELNANCKVNSLKTEDFKEMKYLDHVIKESMRLHPSINRISRSIPDGTTLGGITFPACSVVVEIKYMNRNPAVWQNPLDFIPERFEKFEAGKKNPFVYIPFSAGPRNCIGQRFAMLELKIALYHLIRTFRVTSLQKESELKETFGITHGCEGGLFISLEKRI